MRSTGLDFGTSTTLVARARGAGGVEVMSLGHSTTWLPSVAAPDGSGSLIVGEDADQSSEAIRSIKTCITNNQRTITMQSSRGPCELDADLIASAIIREARERALSVDPHFDFSAVRVGCPAEWDRAQRIRLQGVLRDAGIDVALADILDEPVAAAIAWIDQRQRSGTPSTEEMSRLLVFDYGGGTLDIAVCEITWKQHHPEITVLSCDGVTDAGDRLDQALANDVTRMIRQAHGVDPGHGAGIYKAAIQLAVRRAKEELSAADETTVDLAHFGLPSIDLTRQELENSFRPQLERALEFVTYCMRGAKLRELGHPSPAELRKVPFSELATEIDHVLLAGGMSQIPLVGSLMQTKFPRARIEHVTEGQGAGARRPQHAIVSGLVHDSDTYDRLNLHRPGFNIHLRWKDGGGVTHTCPLYEAHTRIYSPQDIYMNVTDPRYYRRFPIPASAPSQHAQFVVTTESGEFLTLRLDRAPLDHLKVRVRGNDHVAISLYVDGRLMVSVNDEPQVLVRVERWHVIRGKRRSIELRSIRPRGTSQPKPPPLDDWRFK